MLLLLLNLLFAQPALAQSQSNAGSSGQIPQDRILPLQTIQDYRPPGTLSTLNDILKNIHGSYSVGFMGPRLTGATNETYNIYLPDKAPIQLYHTFKLGYQVSPDLQVGIDENIVNNVAEDVQGFSTDSNGKPIIANHYGKTFEYYDPDIYFNLPNLVKVQGWRIFTSASFSFPVTLASVNLKRITQLIIQQSWTRQNFGSDWSYGFHLYLNPQFYTDPIPDGILTRETFSFSAGPDLRYRVSNLFTLSASAVLDVQHNSPDSQGFFHLSDGLPDYIQFRATIFPNVYPMWMSIQGYFQSLIWNPSWETSILGAGISIGF